MLVRHARPTPRGIAFVVLVVAAILVPVLFLVLQATAPQQVEGFVINVRTRAPLGVASFDLLAGDGRQLTFTIGKLDVSNGFDAGHLVTHQLTLQPVIVTYREEGGQLIAIKLADGVAVPSGAALPSVPGASGAPGVAASASAATSASSPPSASSAQSASSGPSSSLPPAAPHSSP